MKQILLRTIIGLLLLGLPAPAQALRIETTMANWTASFADEFYGPTNIGTGGTITEETSGLMFTGTGYRKGNLLATASTLDLRDATTYIKWRADGGGKYMQINVGLFDSTILGAGAEFSYATPGGWHRYEIISPNTWYFTRCRINADRSYQLVTATDNYDDQGGTTYRDSVADIPHQISGVLTEDQFQRLSNGRIAVGLADNYASTISSITIGEVVFLSLSTAPEIAVQCPDGIDLSDNGGTLDFGTANAGTVGEVKVCTIHNIGTSAMTGIAVTKDGSSSADYTVNTESLASNLAPGASTTFTVAFAPGTTGSKLAAIHILNSDADENPFDITLAGQGTLPEIGISDSTGTNMQSGDAADFGTIATGKHAFRTLQIANIGDGSLTGIDVNIVGPDASDFVISVSPSNTVVPGGSTSITIGYAPNAAGGRLAFLHLTSNDPDENPFDIRLVGSSLSPTADTDGDQLNDWAEYCLTTLGFNWQVANTELVEKLFAGANAAGLYTPSQVQALHISTPLLARDPVSGMFTLAIAVEKSADINHFTPIPITTPQITVNEVGEIVLRFSSPDEAAFFRVETK